MQGNPGDGASPVSTAGYSMAAVTPAGPPQAQLCVRLGLSSSTGRALKCHLWAGDGDGGLELPGVIIPLQSCYFIPFVALKCCSED